MTNIIAAAWQNWRDAALRRSVRRTAKIYDRADRNRTRADLKRRATIVKASRGGVSPTRLALDTNIDAEDVRAILVDWRIKRH